MVTPPAWIAAMPVGASTTIRLCNVVRSLRKNVVFPVPAFPVRNRLVPVVESRRIAILTSGFSSGISSAIQLIYAGFSGCLFRPLVTGGVPENQFYAFIFKTDLDASSYPLPEQRPGAGYKKVGTQRRLPPVICRNIFRPKLCSASQAFTSLR